MSSKLESLSEVVKKLSRYKAKLLSPFNAVLNGEKLDTATSTALLLSEVFLTLKEKGDTFLKPVFATPLPEGGVAVRFLLPLRFNEIRRKVEVLKPLKGELAVGDVAIERRREDGGRVYVIFEFLGNTFLDLFIKAVDDRHLDELSQLLDSFSSPQGQPPAFPSSSP